MSRRELRTSSFHDDRSRSRSPRHRHYQDYSPRRHPPSREDSRNSRGSKESDYGRRPFELHTDPQRGSERRFDNVSPHANMIPPNGPRRHSGRGPSEDSPIADKKSLSQAEASENGDSVQSKVVSLLLEFGDRVAKKVALQFSTDSAKAALKTKTAELESLRTHQSEWPALAESQQLNVDRAQKKCDALERRLKDESVELTSTLKALAEKISPLTSGDVKAPQADQGLARNYENLENRCREQFNQLRELQKDFNELKDQHLDTRIKVKDNLKELIPLRQELHDRKKENANPNKAGQVLPSDITDIRVKVGKLSQRLDEYPTLKVEISKAVQESKAMSKKMSEELLNLATLRDSVQANSDSGAQLKVEFQVSLHELEGRWQESMSEMAAGIQEVRHKLNNLALKSLEPEPAVNSTNTIQDSATPIVNLETRISNIEKETRLDIIGIRAAQEEGDKAYGELIGDLETKYSRLETQFQDIQKVQNVENSKLLSNMDTALNSVAALQSEVQKIKSQSLTVAEAGHKSPVSVPAQTPPDVNGIAANMNQQLEQKSVLIQENLRNVFSEEVKMLHIAVRSLNSRFDNLTTADMAGYILNQMQSFYPQVANLDATLKDLISRSQAHDLALNNISQRLAAVENGSIERIEGGHQAIIQQNLRGINEAIETVTQTKLNDVHQRLTAVEGRSIENQESSVHADIRQSIEQVHKDVQTIADVQIKDIDRRLAAIEARSTESQVQVAPELDKQSMDHIREDVEKRLLVHINGISQRIDAIESRSEKDVLLPVANGTQIQHDLNQFREDLRAATSSYSNNNDQITKLRNEHDAFREEYSELEALYKRNSDAIGDHIGEILYDFDIINPKVEKLIADVQQLTARVDSISPPMIKRSSSRATIASASASPATTKRKADAGRANGSAAGGDGPMPKRQRSFATKNEVHEEEEEEEGDDEV